MIASLARSACVIVMCAPVAVGQLRLRGESRDDARIVVETGPQGVTIREADGREVIVGWHVVKQVDGRWASQIQPHADLAWRAWSRLGRGDTALAEPLFEELAATLDGAGPTSAMAASGLVQCRLARGAYVAATVSWASLRAMPGEAAEMSARLASMPGGGSSPVDRRTLLAPALPPMFLPGAGLARIVEVDAGGDAVLAWYRVAAAAETGGAVDVPEVADDRSLDVELVSSIVLARMGEPLERRRGRATLERLATEHAGTWIEAWCRAGIGRSLVRETDRESVLLGAIELLHVPVRFAVSQPWLASTCQAEAALALDRVGNSDGATALAADLVRRWPGSAAANDARIRALGGERFGQADGRAGGPVVGPVIDQAMREDPL